MSVYSEPYSYRRSSLHRRDDSGELDVFEAARYFSGYSDVISCNSSPTNLWHRNIARDGYVIQSNNVRDMYDAGQGLEPGKGKISKHGHNRRQPSSPGGRLASFLNSLFSQSSKRKKKSSKSLMAQSLKDHDKYDVEESSGSWRRRRRSSVSHFRSSSNMLANTTGDVKAPYSSSGSGFPTPPFSQSHKDMRTVTFGYNDKHAGEGSSIIGSGFGTRSYEETNRKTRSGTMKRECLSRNRNLIHDDDEDNISDSSSDLFELEICDLGYCSSGLPVYETTRIDSIKRGPSISNVVA